MGDRSTHRPVRHDRIRGSPASGGTASSAANSGTTAVSRPALGPSAPRIRSRTWLRGGSDVALAPAPVQRGDDGRGGADLAGGSGLVGLKDRMEALGGRLSVQSAPGAGTTVQSALYWTRPGADCFRRRPWTICEGLCPAAPRPLPESCR
jgi:hypothetical protein